MDFITGEKIKSARTEEILGKMIHDVGGGEGSTEMQGLFVNANGANFIYILSLLTRLA